jgi:hypothetical protein
MRMSSIITGSGSNESVSFFIYCLPSFLLRLFSIGAWSTVNFPTIVRKMRHALRLTEWHRCGELHQITTAIVNKVMSINVKGRAGDGNWESHN